MKHEQERICVQTIFLKNSFEEPLAKTRNHPNHEKEIRFFISEAKRKSVLRNKILQA